MLGHGQSYVMLILQVMLSCAVHAVVTRLGCLDRFLDGIANDEAIFENPVPSMD